MMSGDFTRATADDHESWKTGLIERVSHLMDKAALLEQKVDLLALWSVQGAKQANLTLLVSDKDVGQQTYIFTIAQLAEDNYHVFVPGDFVVPHEDIAEAPRGYSLNEPDGLLADRFLYDLARNCQVDGEIDIERYVIRKPLEIRMQ